MRRRRVLALAASSLLLVARTTSAADSVVIQDHSDFSIDIGPLDPCVMRPLPLRGRPGCEGLEKATPSLPADEQTLAAGIARLEGGARAIFQLQRSRDAEDHGPTSVADAQEYFVGMVETLERNWPGSTHRTSPIRTAALPGGARAFRGTITSVGAPANFAGFDHQAILLVDRYTLFLMGPHDASAQMDAVIDRLRVTVAPRSEAKPTSDAGAPLGGYAAIAGALVLVAVAVWHRARRRRA